MRNSRTGGALIKVLLAIFFIAILAAFMRWQSGYGVIGRVESINFDTTNRIVFVRQEDGGSTNLFVVKDDGTDLRRLTNDKSQKHSPAWSPDGGQICYAAQIRSEGSETFQLFVKGTGDSVQTTYGSEAKDLPQWRPDGKAIAYLGGGRIKLVDPNGNKLEQIYPHPHKDKSGGDGDEAEMSSKRPPINSFRWSPDGVDIAAVQVTDGESAPAIGQGNWWQLGINGEAASDKQAPQMMMPESVLVMNSGDADKPAMLPGADKVSIAWFRDGTRLAVALSSQKSTHALVIYRTDVQNLSPEIVLAATGYTVAPENPSVSPDGSKIAFEVWRMEGAENRELIGISVLPTTVESTISVTTPNAVGKVPIAIKGSVHAPQWSPDGTKLLYWKSGKNGRDLWVANADGSSAVNLTKGAGGDNFDAAWSPKTPKR